jgi:hypothetical protein
MAAMAGSATAVATCGLNRVADSVTKRPSKTTIHAGKNERLLGDDFILNSLAML